MHTDRSWFPAAEVLVFLSLAPATESLTGVPGTWGPDACPRWKHGQLPDRAGAPDAAASMRSLVYGPRAEVDRSVPVVTLLLCSCCGTPHVLGDETSRVGAHPLTCVAHRGFGGSRRHTGGAVSRGSHDARTLGAGSRKVSVFEAPRVYSGADGCSFCMRG